MSLSNIHVCLAVQESGHWLLPDSLAPQLVATYPSNEPVVLADLSGATAIG